MGFENKPAIVIKSEPNKKVVVSDSVAVYTDHNSVTVMDGDKVVVSSDNRYTRLENGKLTYEDGPIREFNLPTTKEPGTYTLATTNDIPTIPTLATVATTGSYNDLTDQPSIPSPM